MVHEIRIPANVLYKLSLGCDYQNFQLGFSGLTRIQPCFFNCFVTWGNCFFFYSFMGLLPQFKMLLNVTYKNKRYLFIPTRIKLRIKADRFVDTVASLTVGNTGAVYRRGRAVCCVDIWRLDIVTCVFQTLSAAVTKCQWSRRRPPRLSWRRGSPNPHR